MFGALILLAGIVLAMLGIRGTYKIFAPWSSSNTLSASVNNAVSKLSTM